MATMDEMMKRRAWPTGPTTNNPGGFPVPNGNGAGGHDPRAVTDGTGGLGAKPPGGGNNGGNQPNNPNTVLPAFMPGQLSALSQQLNAGFGGGVKDWRQDLQNTYDPTVIKPFNFNTAGGGKHNGNGHNGNGNDDQGGNGNGGHGDGDQGGYQYNGNGFGHSRAPGQYDMAAPPPPPPPGFGLLSNPPQPPPASFLQQGILGSMPPPPPPPQQMGGVQGVQGIQGMQQGQMFGGQPPSMANIPPNILELIRQQRMQQGGR